MGIFSGLVRWFNTPFSHSENTAEFKENSSPFDDFVVIDVETTGLSEYKDKMIQVAAVRYVNHKMSGRFVSYVNPGMPIPAEASRINGITNDMVRSAPKFEAIQDKYFSFVKCSPLVVGYNVKFDLQFLSAESGMDLFSAWRHVDVLSLAREALPMLPNYKLSTVSQHIGFNANFHDALADCRACGQVLNYLCSKGLIPAEYIPRPSTPASRSVHKSTLSNPNITDIEYIRNQLKTTGIFQGRQFNPTDEFHIEKGTFTVRPHGISQPEAQKALDVIPVGQALQISAGVNILVVRSLKGVLLGDIQWQDVKDLQTVYDMVKSGFKVECSLSQKGQFWADNVKKKIWWCEIALPSYDVWSLTGATVWATRIRRYYHCNPDCNKNADRHMTVEEAEYRGMTKCPKCYHLKPAQSDGPSIKKLHRLSAQMTGSDWEYSLKVERILDSAGRETSDIVTRYNEGLHYKNGQVFFGVKLDGKLRYITLFVDPQSIHCNYTVTPADQGRGPGYCRIYIPSPDALDEISEYIITAFDRAKEIYEQPILT